MRKLGLIAAIAVIAQLLISGFEAVNAAADPAAVAQAIEARLTQLTQETGDRYLLLGEVRQAEGYAVASVGQLEADGSLVATQPLLVLARQKDAIWHVSLPQPEEYESYNRWLEALSPGLLSDEEKPYFRVTPAAEIIAAQLQSVSGYRLPFAGGWWARVSQGPYGGFSHSSLWAVDFVLPTTGGRIGALTAAKDGVIWFVKDVSDIGGTFPGASGYSNGVVIKHAANEYSWYWHLAYNSVPPEIQPGVLVEAGTYIGRQGTTGYSTGNHLHFQVTTNFPTWLGCTASGCTDRETRVDRAPWSSNTRPVDFVDADASAWTGCSGSANCNATPVSQNYLDRSTGVVLYFDADYRGAAWKRQEPYSGNVPAWIDARATSISLANGWWARLYDGHEFGGSPQDIEDSIPNLDVLGLDNAISSLELDTAWTHTKALDNAWVWPWKFLIGTDDPRVTELYLNGEPLFSRPDCSWVIRWLEPDAHVLDYRAQRRFYLGSDHGFLEVQPWPYAATTCATDSSPDPVGPIPTRLDSATLLNTAPVPATIVAGADQTVTQRWELRNSGTTVWKAGYVLHHVAGERLGEASVKPLSVAAPGEMVKLQIEVQAPEEPGRHTGYWQLRNAQGTYFGPLLQAQVDVPALTDRIVRLSIDPPSPADTTQALIYVDIAKSETAPFRAARLKIDDEVVTETAKPAFIHTWDTTGYTPGDYSVVVEVADQTDTAWERPQRRATIYRLTGTTTPQNHAPFPPRLTEPADHAFSYAWGNAGIELCAEPQGDPNGDAITDTYFEIFYSHQTWQSGWVAGPCVTTPPLPPYPYLWRARVRDSHGAESNWSAPREFTVVDFDLRITQIRATALDEEGATVQIHACTDAPDDADVTLRIDVNEANDGSSDGAWQRIAELKTRCLSDDDLLLWNTLPFTDGLHRLRVTAYATHPDWNGTAQREIAVRIPPDYDDDTPPRRPAGPVLIAPRHPDGLTATAYLDEPTITFHWAPGLRATGYTLHVASSPSPATATTPLLRQALGADVLTFTHTLPTSALDAGLYWQVTATNDQGATASATGQFARDVTAPICAIETLSPSSSGEGIEVSWSVDDAAENSLAAGLAHYDIQLRDSADGTWRDWLLNLPATRQSALFVGLTGHTYAFRCRATDQAGNTGSYTSQIPAPVQMEAIPSGAPGTADLAVLSMNTAPEPSGGVAVEVVIANQGTQTTQHGFLTDLYLNHTPEGPNDSTGRVHRWTNAPVEAGKTITLTTVFSNAAALAPWTPAVPLTEITGTLQAWVDLAGWVTEDDEANNVSAPSPEFCVATDDEYEIDDTPQTAHELLLDAPQIRNLARPGDEDWLKLRTVAGVQYTIATSDLGPRADTALTVYAPNGITRLAVSHDRAPGDLSSRIRWIAPSSDSYYLVVRSWNPTVNGCGTTYVLQATASGEKTISLYLPAVVKGWRP